jgi:hypothetical protein
VGVCGHLGQDWLQIAIGFDATEDLNHWFEIGGLEFATVCFCSRKSKSGHLCETFSYSECVVISYYETFSYDECVVISYNSSEITWILYDDTRFQPDWYYYY